MADSIFKNWTFLDPEEEAENELRDIAEEVRGLRLSEVLEHHGVHIEIDTGSEKKALCPFHIHLKSNTIFTANFRTTYFPKLIIFQKYSLHLILFKISSLMYIPLK